MTFNDFFLVKNENTDISKTRVNLKKHLSLSDLVAKNYLKPVKYFRHIRNFFVGQCYDKFCKNVEIVS